MNKAGKSTGEYYSFPFMEEDMMKDVTIPYDKYQDNIEEILNKYGFVVVTGILSKNEIDNAVSLIYNDLLQTIDEKMKYDPKLNDVIKQIKNGKLHWPYMSLPGIVKKGFLSTHGIPQGECAWTLRINEKVRLIYEHLHKSNDLVVGTDVVFFNTNKDTYTQTDLWPHADQDIDLKTGSEKSYQGILYVLDSTKPNSTNTVVLPMSWDKEYHTLKNNSVHTGKHSFYISEMTDAKTKKELMDYFIKNARRVQVPAGGLLIFNSRTIHQGFPSGYRFAQPISWEPKTYRSDSALKSKLKCIHGGLATMHWASLGMPHGASFIKPKQPYYSDDVRQCILPMKKIKPFPIIKDIHDYESKSTRELLANIKPEYAKYI
jgi:hypothetical protein